jgi:hypothetical protein
MNIVYMFIGISLGVLIGVLPGLGGANGVAILLPLTFSMPPTSAIIMLSCIYWGALFGGAITSILFNIPGEPWSVATTFDGYPLAQQGRAGEALTAAFTSSFIGALFAVIGVTFLAPLIASMALAFGPAELFAVQLGGPVGTLAELGDAGPAVRARLAAALDLADAPCWHSQRDRIVRFADWLSHISGTLGKLGQDVALMAQDGISEVALSGAGGSSAMAHKQNPVAAEVVVALARYNAVLVSALHQAQVHEQERSGAAWTLEWLVLPQMAAATGAALRLALRLVSQIERVGGADG